MFEGTTFYSNMQTLSRFFDIFVDEQPLHPTLYTLHPTLAAPLPIKPTFPPQKKAVTRLKSFCFAHQCSELHSFEQKQNLSLN
jgi:hypothetical protein